MPQERLIDIRKKISHDLDRVVKFWTKHSHDDTFGGFFTCLGKDGAVYDDTKYGWLNARQVWMYSKLYNDVERFHVPELLDAAKRGAEFLRSKIKFHTDDGLRCYFSVTKDGKPLKVQRTIYTECFYVMAMSEMAKATNDYIYKDEALAMMEQIIHWVLNDDTGLGRPKLAGHTPSIILGYPMMIICALLELFSLDECLVNKYGDVLDWAVSGVMKHVQRDGSIILETVSPDGKEISGSEGRLMNPGHALECGWFLLRIARMRNDRSLGRTAIETFIEKPYAYGLDGGHGGILYFLDADGLCPAQLEWNMKLWWVHNEAMIACLMAYQETGLKEHYDRFESIFEYCYKHFVDEEAGEWFGYLNRQGEVNMDFKGGVWKGCFHLPRCLMVCETILTDIIQRNK